ncbi:MAG: hypothetical protein JW984_16215 [Deltaproteobacteria bacterium]|uniref:Uncharacterized protein n=1 Tax=Candidatus Zymogenus saltonus TaxID=2844893 RepID=A0A9D8PSF2_9DELT|nr:hypothetical protein [Candidatus Zymogenus saltonus]
MEEKIKRLITIAAFLCCFIISGISTAEYCPDVNAYCVKYKTRTTGNVEANLIYYAKTLEEANEKIRYCQEITAVRVLIPVTRHNTGYNL